jgi:hypothetical protein
MLCKQTARLTPNSLPFTCWAACLNHSELAEVLVPQANNDMSRHMNKQSIEVIGLLIGLITLVVAILAWIAPFGPVGPSPYSISKNNYRYHTVHYILIAKRLCQSKLEQHQLEREN